jgi:hypothetical protein
MLPAVSGQTKGEKMGTENTESTVAAGESTPTPAEPVEKVAESTESTQQPDLSGDAWADWGKDAKDDEPEAKTEELAAKTDDKSPAKPEAKTDATKHLDRRKRNSTSKTRKR